MTKEEFIQKAVLTLLANNSGGSAECITGFANELADAVYGKENVVEKKLSQTGFENESINNVITEVDRIDQENTDKRKKEIKERGGYCHRCQKSGYAVRLQNALNNLEIKTVGDLLSLGRTGLYYSLNVGKHGVDIVTDALYNLYKIRF